jgi:hypothetical protein
MDSPCLLILEVIVFWINIHGPFVLKDFVLIQTTTRLTIRRDEGDHLSVEAVRCPAFPRAILDANTT